MTQIDVLTPEQAALIPEYQEKWNRLCYSTQLLERIRAEAAIKGAYALLKRPEPKVVFCESPRAAMEQLSDYVAAVEMPAPAATPSAETFAQDMPKKLWEAKQQSVKAANQRRKSGAKDIHSLMDQVSQDARKTLMKHIDKELPRKVSIRDAFEQAFSGQNSVIAVAEDAFAQQGMSHSNPVTPQEAEDSIRSQPEEQWRSFDKMFSWIPGKNWLLRQWLKGIAASMLLARVSQFLSVSAVRSTVLLMLSAQEQQFLQENPAVTTAELAAVCLLLDYGAEVLGYPRPQRQWDALQGLTKHCGWIFAVKDLCVVCDRPIHIRLNEKKQIHADGKPAIEYSDGFSIYVRRGRIVPEKYGAAPVKDWQSQWAVDETSQPQQQMLMEGIGAERLCEELATEVVEADGEYTLLELVDIKPRKTFVLRRTDSETDDVYAVLIPVSPKSLLGAVRYARRHAPKEQFPLPEISR